MRKGGKTKSSPKTRGGKRGRSYNFSLREGGENATLSSGTYRRYVEDLLPLNL